MASPALTSVVAGVRPRAGGAQARTQAAAAALVPPMQRGIPSRTHRHGLVLSAPAPASGTAFFGQRGHRSSVVACAVSAGTDLLSEKALRRLQNGSDFRGVAMEGVEGESVNLTPEVVTLLGKAFATWLAEKIPGKESYSVVVGHDSRLTADMMYTALTEGLTSCGVDVLHSGLSSTPAMFTATFSDAPEIGCPTDAGMMITASHLPFNRNGIKLFTKDGGLSKKDITAVLDIAVKGEFLGRGGGEGSVRPIPFMTEVYAPGLVAKVREAAGGEERPLEGMKIVVDAGNGAGGFFATDVLQPLGADTEGSVFLDPDGSFPNHIPNPEEKAAIEAIQGAVAASGADLGVIFDTDVDRSGLVTADGLEINRNRLIALLSAVVLEEHPGTTIVTDSVTSDGLSDFIGAAGGTHLRFKRGYKNVIDEAVRLNEAGQDAQLAIETSGHGAFKENRWLDDGAYSVVKLLMRLARTDGAERRGEVQRLVDTLAEAEASAEIRLKITEEDFGACGTRVLEGLESEARARGWKVAEPSYEGVRVSMEGGWALLRLSLHDPVMPLNIEAPSEDAARKIAGQLLEAIAQFDGPVDLTPVRGYVGGK